MSYYYDYSREPRYNHFVSHEELQPDKFYIIHLYNNPTNVREFMRLCGIFIKKVDNALYFKQVIKSEYNYKYIHLQGGSRWNYTRYENPHEEFSVFDSTQRFYIYNDLTPENYPFLEIPRKLNEINFDYFLLRIVEDMFCSDTQRKNMTDADYNELNYLITKFKMDIKPIINPNNH